MGHGVHLPAWVGAVVMCGPAHPGDWLSLAATPGCQPREDDEQTGDYLNGLQRAALVVSGATCTGPVG